MLSRRPPRFKSYRQSYSLCLVSEREFRPSAHHSLISGSHILTNCRKFALFAEGQLEIETAHFRPEAHLAEA